MNSTASAATHCRKAAKGLWPFIVGIGLLWIGCAQPPTADLVLFNCVVHTLDPELGTLSAVAIFVYILSHVFIKSNIRR